MMPLGTQQDIYKALPLTQVEENLSNKVLPDSSGQGFRMVLRMEVGNLLGELPHQDGSQSSSVHPHRVQESLSPWSNLRGGLLAHLQQA